MSENKTIEESWRLLDLAQNILPFGNPVQKCHRVPRGKVRIMRKGKEHYYDDVTTCKSAWSCPICSPRLALKRARSVKKLHSELDYDSILVTYTISHNIRDELVQLLNDLYDSLRAARNGTRGKMFRKLTHGYIRTTEITYGKNGWHPHIHELIYMKKGTTINQIKDTVIKHYKEAVEKVGKLVNSYTVDAKKWDGDTSYITKNSDIDEVIGWFTKDSKSSLNIFQILRRSEDSGRYSKLYEEYYFSTKRRKITIVSRSLTEDYEKAKKEAEEEFEIQSESDPVLVHEFAAEEWAEVCRKKVRYQILMTLSGETDE